MNLENIYFGGFMQLMLLHCQFQTNISFYYDFKAIKNISKEQSADI